MSSELTSALEAVIERLLPLAAADPQVRADLRRLAEALLDLTTEPVGKGPAPPPAGPHAPSLPVGAFPLPADGTSSDATKASGSSLFQPPASAFPSLSRGGEGSSLTEAPARTGPRRGLDLSDEELGHIRARCLLKAEACRWARRRRLQEQRGADFRRDIDPIDQELIQRARTLPECYLWMCSPDAITPADLELYELTARCFEVVVHCMDNTQAILSDLELFRDEFEVSLELLAEAQSALRAAVQRLGHGSDPDQTLIFSWLRMLTDEYRVFIPRFMRVDDPADLTALASLADRAADLSRRLEEIRKRSKLRKKLFGKLRHKVSVLRNDSDGLRTDEWRILISTVDQLVQDGVPPSNVQLREQLLQVLDNLPEGQDLPPSFQRVLHEIDRYLASRPTESFEQDPTLLEESSPEVREVAELLRGQAVVLIGGDRRPAAAEALQRSFQLGELIWIETREHESILGFEPYVARPEVVVVLLAIRWSSHSFSEVKRFCDQHDKPLVRLPAGYNPKQVARQILLQCSERLRSRQATA